MKYYKYYETTSDYEADISKIGEDDHYTIYIADTDKTLINKKYVDNTAYFTYANSGKNIQIAYEPTLIKSAICLNTGKEITIPEGGFRVNFDPTGIEGNINIKFIFKPENTHLNNCFLNCTDLISITGDVFRGLNYIRSFENTFANCSKLTSIPDKLFYYNINAESFSHVFKFCESLINIPNNLFYGNKNAITFTSAFYGCTSLTAIPDKLFYYNNKATSFKLVFYGCTGINKIPLNLFTEKINSTGSISFAGIFERCSNLNFDNINIEDSNYIFPHTVGPTSFKNAFLECTALTTLPNNIFNIVEATTDLTQTFYGCTSLREISDNVFSNIKSEDFERTFARCNNITTIPMKLFSNSNSTKSFTGTFAKCTSLTSIPSELFYNNTEVTKFKNTFDNCSNLESISPELFSKNTLVKKFINTFSNCEKLTTIPSSLFSANTNVTDFVGTFANCTGITSIPDNLFSSNINVTDFVGTFENCTSINSIGENLFLNTQKAKVFTKIFSNCSSLTTIPAKLFNYATNAASFKKSFMGCTSLTEIPQGLFSNNDAVTDFTDTFRKCTSLTIITNNIFSDFDKTTTFCGTFMECNNVTTVQPSLFNNRRKAQIFRRTFQDCTKLNSIYQSNQVLFSDCPRANSFKRTFKNCHGLTTLPNSLFANNKHVYKFYQTFAECINLTGATPYDSEYGKLWERPYPVSVGTEGKYIVGNGCFRNCAGLIEYANIIPNYWKGKIGNDKPNVDVYLYATKTTSLDSSDLAKGTTIKMGITNTSENIIESGTTITINYNYDGELSMLLPKTITVQQNVNRNDSISLEIQALKTINGNYYGLKNITLSSDKYNFNIIKGNLLLQLNEFKDAINTSGLPIAGKWASFTPEFNLTGSQLPIITTGTLCLGLTDLTVNCNLINSQHIWSCHLSYSSYSSEGIPLRNQIQEEFGTLDTNGDPEIDNIESKEIVIRPESCPLYNTITVRFYNEKVIS